MQKDADAKAAKLKDRNVTRGSASFAAAKVADDVKQELVLNNIKAPELV